MRLSDEMCDGGGAGLSNQQNSNMIDLQYNIAGRKEFIYLYYSKLSLIFSFDSACPDTYLCNYLRKYPSRNDVF